MGPSRLSVPFLDLSRQIDASRRELQAAIDDVLDSGALILGSAVESFEDQFAEYCGVDHAVGVASGTDAITIALQAVGVRRGDEVVTAANTCVPTIAGIAAAGARPVLADVDNVSFTIDIASLESVISERTTAIVPVHLYGQCADMDGVRRIADRYGLKVIEDAAQAHGAEYIGRRAGALGDAAAFSFYPTKNLGALGDGGAVVTFSAEVAEQARLLRNYGERTRYDSIREGWNSRLDGLQAAVLSAKLNHLDQWNMRRRDLAEMYMRELSDADVILPIETDSRRHVYHLFVLRVADRDEFRDALSRDGIGTLVHYPRPVHLHPAYASLSRKSHSLSVSETLATEVVSLPLYPELSAGEVECVVSTILRHRPRTA